MLFLTIFTFILVISILIISHESFHFIVAKKTNLVVEEFCIGYPPRIFKKKKGDTTYSIGLFPGGGFVKIQGIDDPEKKEAYSFYSKSLKARFFIVLAGVVANFLLAVILFSIGFSIGLPEAIKDEIPVGARDVGISIVEVAKNSPAEISGIKMGDKVLKIREPESGEEKEIKKVWDVKDFTERYPGQELVITLQRRNQTLEKKVIARENPPQDEGPIGIVMVKTARISYPWYKAILKGVENTFWLTKTTLEYIFKALKGAVVGKPLKGVELTGPIGIGLLVSQMVNLGWIYVLQFTAILSLNLAIINILPFPALDGGRLIFLFVESIRKHPINPKIENLVNNIGFAILLILMLIVSLQDIKRLLGLLG